MADFLDEFMQDQEPSEEAPAPENIAQPEEVTEQPVPEPQPEAEAAPEPEPVEQKEDEPRVIPLATALNWRDEAKEAKRREAELQRRITEFEASKAQPNSMPDPFDDPAGFAAYQDQKIEQRMMQERFALSDTVARQQHGAETVEAAVQWAQGRAQQDPMFAGSYMRQQHPIDWIVQQHKRDALLSDIGDNPDDWFTREAAKRGYAPQSAPVAAPVAAVAQTVAKPPAPPRSIASERTAPAPVTPEGDKDGFLAAFR